MNSTERPVPPWVSRLGGAFLASIGVYCLGEAFDALDAPAWTSPTVDVIVLGLLGIVLLAISARMLLAPQTLRPFSQTALATLAVSMALIGAGVGTYALVSKDFSFLSFAYLPGIIAAVVTEKWYARRRLTSGPQRGVRNRDAV